MFINQNNLGQFFNKGDKVVCIEDIGWNDLSAQDFILKKNMIFTVLDTITFNGVQSLDIGARFNDETKQTKQFLSNESIPGPGIHWAASFRFKKVNDSEIKHHESLLRNELMGEIKLAVDNEEFELAIKLRDVLSDIDN